MSFLSLTGKRDFATRLYPRLTSLSPDAFPKLRVLASCQMKATTSHRTKIGSATLVDPLSENLVLLLSVRGSKKGER